MKKIYKKRKLTKHRSPTNSPRFFGPSVQLAPQQQSEENELQAKSTGSPAAKVNSPFFNGYLSQLNNKGKALQPETRRFFESRMGTSFAPVKLHTDDQAKTAAEALQAKAFAINNHIVFNHKYYNEHSQEGKHLLAHELTHIMQQKGQSPGIQRTEDPKEISAPIPKDAVINEETGDASFTISGLKFVAEPDGVIDGDKITWREQEVEPEKSGATTAFALDYRISFSKKADADVYTKASVSYTIYLKTFYKKGVDKNAPSGYGRGTTPDDKKAGNISLKFHESQHGKDIQDYITANPLPTVKLKFPATQAQYDAAKTKLAEAIAAYSLAVQTHSEQHTDEVGNPKTPVPPPATEKTKAE